jgi:YjbE family integral membrane protein
LLPLFHFASSGFFALLQVILIDIVLAGDNAVVIGMAASRVPKQDRRKVIFWGLFAAVAIRVALATITVQLLEVIGLMFAGGILLLWVAWRLYRDIRQEFNVEPEQDGFNCTTSSTGTGSVPPLSDVDSRYRVRRAIFQITLADISMSLDNVLAVAGAAVHHIVVLAIGLLLSIALMGMAASMIARLLSRYPWVSYAGLFIVVYVAITMIVQGGQMVLHAM